MVLLKNMKKICFFLLVLITALAMSCTDFFSNSWASRAARNPDKLVPPVNAGNVDKLIADAENYPDLSMAILKKIEEAMNGGMSPEDIKKLQNAALEAATNAVGLGSAVLNTVTEILDIDMNDIDEAAGIVLDAINNMKNLDTASDTLKDILPPPKTSEFDEWAAGANADDLAMAAVLLLAGEIKDLDGDNINDIWNTINSNPAEYERAELALAIVDAIDIDELSDPLKNVLKGLKLN